jgi:hypothetical protein
VLEHPDYGAEDRISKVLCIEGDVGVVGGYAGDLAEIKHGGEEDLRTEEDGVDKVEDVWIEFDDAGEGDWREEVPF